MLVKGSTKFGQVAVGKELAGSLWIGVKEGGKIIAVKMWTAITSCFGSGWWRSEDSWSNDDAWVD